MDARILDNLTERSGIKIIGENGPGNVVAGNRHAVPGQANLEDFAGSELKDNIGYVIIREE
jgi:hypothetical protein